jgi:DNA repair photolyase
MAQPLRVELPVRTVPIVKRASFIKQFEGPAETSGIVCFRFWELVVAAGCPYQCSYCFLQATPSYVYGHYPLEGAIFANWQQMLDEVRDWLSHPVPRMLLVGELQDGLAFEGAYKRLTGRSVTEMLVPLFAAQTRHRLIFLTKSVAVRYLLRMPPTDRVVLSWSVNAEEVGRRWEIGAPLPSRRLEAARKVEEGPGRTAGRSVRQSVVDAETALCGTTPAPGA